MTKWEMTKKILGKVLNVVLFFSLVIPAFFFSECRNPRHE